MQLVMTSAHESVLSTKEIPSAVVDAVSNARKVQETSKPWESVASTEGTQNVTTRTLVQPSVEMIQQEMTVNHSRIFLAAIKPLFSVMKEGCVKQLQAEVNALIIATKSLVWVLAVLLVQTSVNSLHGKNKPT